MAHELMEHDEMMSVRERPWHGLGVVIEDYPTIEEAKEHSGLNWSASVRPSFYLAGDEYIRIPGTNAVVRDDVDVVIGTVGDRYEVYQNNEMWDFIDSFQFETGCKLETAGSLRNGATTWVLAKNGTVEYVSGDPVEEYFLFRNSFNGSTPIMAMFTNIRVVCNNTLSAAIRGAGNIFKVKHTLNAENQLIEVRRALGLREKYRDKLNDAMQTLTGVAMTERKIMDVLATDIFPEPKQTIQKGGNVISMKEISKKAITVRKNKINAVLELVENGAGADIPGVKGTAYGLYQALTEWTDHEKSVKVVNNRVREEVRFENAFWGTGAQFKEDCFKKLLKMAV